MPQEASKRPSDASKMPKIASNTVNQWLQCRFGMSDGAPTMEVKDTDMRVTMLRGPKSRSMSGFLQIVSHYVNFVRLSPEDLQTCIDAWLL